MNIVCNFHYQDEEAQVDIIDTSKLPPSLQASVEACVSGPRPGVSLPYDEEEFFNVASFFPSGWSAAKIFPLKVDGICDIYLE